MKLKKFQPLLEVFVASFLFFGLHKVFLYFNENNRNYQNFHFSLETIYSFFFGCSFIIIFILILVKEKSIDNVGNAFLLTTCLKIGISFVLLNPILSSGNPNIGFEKMNFFVIFALFLIIETVVTIRILNSNEKRDS
jgi:hypothetical protein